MEDFMEEIFLLLEKWNIFGAIPLIN